LYHYFACKLTWTARTFRLKAESDGGAWRQQKRFNGVWLSAFFLIIWMNVNKRRKSSRRANIMCALALSTLFSPVEIFMFASLLGSCSKRIKFRARQLEKTLLPHEFVIGFIRMQTSAAPPNEKRVFCFAKKNKNS
jgi:hypothetical protein